MITRDQAIQAMDDGATLLYRYCDDEGNYVDVEVTVLAIRLYSCDAEIVAVLSVHGLAYEAELDGEGFPELFLKAEATK